MSNNSPRINRPKGKLGEMRQEIIGERNTILRIGHSDVNMTLHVIGKHSSGLCDVALYRQTD